MTSYDPKIFQITAIKVALRAWAKHKLKVNRAYTPKNMLAKAGELTGKKYKIGEYLKAADDLEKLADKRAEELRIAARVQSIIADSFGQAM